MVSRRRLRRFIYSHLWDLHFLTHSPWRQFTTITGLLGIALAVSWLTPDHRLTHAPARPTPSVVTVSTDHPSESPLPASYHSTATGNQPSFLNIPSISASGYVQAVGVDQNRQIAVPTNIHLAGWFANTVTPGDLGLSIIDGHLDGYHLPGIFANLAQLKPGDTFEVDLASGLKRAFRIRTVQSLPTSQAAGALFSQLPGVSRQLNLITCGGAFKQASGYDHRIVIAAEYLPPSSR